MKNVRYFVWLILPVTVVVAYLIFGLPHMIWSYDWRDNGTHDPYVPRHYTRCSFIGPYGGFTTYTTNGKCGWIIFRKKQGGRNG